jgi:4'-phosphopantetheinyl transferase
VTLIHPVALAVQTADLTLTGRPKVQALSQRAREALSRSAVFSGLPLGVLEKNADGVPLPSNGIHWSLTHKEAWVAAVAAPFAVGIDLEKIRPVDSRLFRRVASEAEWSIVGRPNQEDFFRLWTAKEAVLKAHGQGIAGLGRCKFDKRVDDDTLCMVYEHSIWTVTHHWIDTDHLMAVTVEPEIIAWHILSAD